MPAVGKIYVQSQMNELSHTAALLRRQRWAHEIMSHQSARAELKRSKRYHPSHHTRIHKSVKSRFRLNHVRMPLSYRAAKKKSNNGEKNPTTSAKPVSGSGRSVRKCNFIARLWHGSNFPGNLPQPALYMVSCYHSLVVLGAMRW